jgi:hypothetical protein
LPLLFEHLIKVALRDAQNVSKSIVESPHFWRCGMLPHALYDTPPSVSAATGASIVNRLIYVEMKTNRAQVHFDALQVELDKWLGSPKHYTVTEHTDFDKAIHVFRVEIGEIPNLIPNLLSDFVHNLRSALDNLAWELAHLPPARTPPFTNREERDIYFPIAWLDDSTYRKRLSLFPSTVTDALDSIQPYHRGNAYRDDRLWQLNELWTLDKHRAIPMNSSNLQLSFSPMVGWERYVRQLEYGVEVHFPIELFYDREMNLKPAVPVEILFGEHMGDFIVSRERLREINNFVRNDVIPRFARFFPDAPDSLK